jgi:hypothetical protein
MLVLGRPPVSGVSPSSGDSLARRARSRSGSFADLAARDSRRWHAVTGERDLDESRHRDPDYRVPQARSKRVDRAGELARSQPNADLIVTILGDAISLGPRKEFSKMHGPNIPELLQLQPATEAVGEDDGV